MTSKRLAHWTVALTLAVVGVGCGGDGGDGDGGDGDGDNGSDTSGLTGESLDPANWPDDPSSDIAPEESAEVGAGEIVEGTFIVTGASDEQYFTSNGELAFGLSGGCEGGGFGFDVDITDPSGEVTFATFGVDTQVDLSGGVTGEFDAVDTAVTVIPNGNTSDQVSYAGPLHMAVSEHAVATDVNASRMTVSLTGAIPSGGGELTVDVTFRWAMACP